MTTILWLNPGFRLCRVQELAIEGWRRIDNIAASSIPIAIQTRMPSLRQASTSTPGDSESWIIFSSMNLRSFSHAFAALLSVGLLASCGDSSSNSPSSSDDPIVTDPTRNGTPSFEGVWKHFEGSTLSQVYEFHGTKVHAQELANGCTSSETWGSFTYSTGYLLVTPDSANMRNAADPDLCSSPASRVTITGTMPIQLESVTASSFVIVEHQFTNSTMQEVRIDFKKQ